MEPESTLPHTVPAATPPLYSVAVIRFFSMFFSTIAGGALMAQNLRAVGQPAAARTALWVSIGYTVVTIWLMSYLPVAVSGLPLLAGYAGAYKLESYFGTFVPNREAFPARAMGKPLVICLLICVPIVALTVYGMSLEE